MRGGGVYSRIGTLLVTDKYGNAVPDGTAISLGLLDSVVAKGKGSIKGKSPKLSGRSNGKFDFDTRCNTSQDCDPAGFNFRSKIVRNDTMQGIEDGYRVIIPNAKAEDKGRFVKGGPNSNFLTVEQDYINNLNPAEFVVGASLLGGEIAGIDENGNPQTGTGATRRGRLPFRVTYPADRDTIGVGCYGSDLKGF